MSSGNLLTDDFVRRLSRMLKHYERRELNTSGPEDTDRPLQPSVMAKITAVMTLGYYQAVEVRYENNGGTEAWAVVTGGRVWGSTNPILEATLSTTVKVGDIVEVSPRTKYFPAAVSVFNRPVQWMFRQGAGVGGPVPGLIIQRFENPLPVGTFYTVTVTDLLGVAVTPVQILSGVKDLNGQDDVAIGTRVFVVSDGTNHRFWTGSFYDTELQAPGTGLIDNTYTGEHTEAVRDLMQWDRGAGVTDTVQGRRVKLTMVVGEAYHDATDMIWYEYRQDFTITSNGTIKRIGGEYRVPIDEPLPY